MIIRAVHRRIDAVEIGITRQVLGYDAELMMVKIAFRSGSVGALHAHPHRQVTYVVHGRFEATIDGCTSVVEAGDCFFVPPDTVHGVLALEDGVLIDVFAPAREEFLK